MQGKSNLVTTIDDFSNIYVQNLTFAFMALNLTHDHGTQTGLE